MTKLARICLIAALLLGLAGGIVRPQTAAAQSRWRFFSETGCWVGNEFLDFFETRGGLDVFGLPLANASVEQNVAVQYFQRARMELRPDQPAPYRIQLGLIGQEVYGKIDPPVPPEQRPSATDPNNRFFPQTGQVASFAFLDYFNSHGGVDIFGYPISGQFTENGTTVQYFQRARMEWHPENAAQYRVQLGLLGTVVFARRGQPTPTPAATAVPAKAAPTVAAIPTKAPAAAAVTVTASTAAPAAPAAPAAAESSTGGLLTFSQIIMFVVTFLVVMLVGLALLWKRGELQVLLARRRPPSAKAADPSGDATHWRPGS